MLTTFLSFAFARNVFAMVSQDFPVQRDPRKYTVFGNRSAMILGGRVHWRFEITDTVKCLRRAGRLIRCSTPLYRQVVGIFPESVIIVRGCWVFVFAATVGEAEAATTTRDKSRRKRCMSAPLFSRLRILSVHRKNRERVVGCLTYRTRGCHICVPVVSLLENDFKQIQPSHAYATVVKVLPT